MKTKNRFNGLLARAPLASAVAIALLVAPAAQAFEFENGELVGSWDTTASFGISQRSNDPAVDLIGKATINPLIATAGQSIPGVPTLGTFPGSAAQIAAPGRFSTNRDDGNTRYFEDDAFSQAFKITSELSLKYRDWGFFTRATYFKDVENDKYEDFLTDEAKEKVIADFRLLDAFIYKGFSLGANDEVSGTIRFGRQVVSWGESTFIQNGINVINPIDVSKLRVAGAELKEAFLPVNMLWGSVKFSETVSLEGFYQLDWAETEIDPNGTYFSSNDFASPGSTYLMLGFGTVAQPVNNPDRFAATCGVGGSVANSDRYAAYVAAYGAPTAGALLTASCGAAVPRIMPSNLAALPYSNALKDSLADRLKGARDTGQFGFALRWYAEALNETEFGFYAVNYHSRLPLLSGVAVTGLAANTGRFFVEYPEDLKMFGISWNTTLPGGIAWQGEYSYRPNAPLQVDDVELLFAALSALNPNFASAPSAQFNSQLGVANFGQEIKGWRSHRVGQLQMTFTKAFGQALGADQIATVLEVGATEVYSLEDQSVLRYEGEGTDTAGGCDIGDALALGIPAGLVTAGCFRNPLTQTNGFPTQFSWGYRLAARADYNSVFGTSITLSPRVAFNHDVSGITPGPGGNFLEGRKSLTLGVEANYLNDWVFDLSYTRFSGAEDLNQIHDRDFASFSVKYSF